MKLFTTQDKKYYRRWVNILPSLLIPGSSQFLSGKRRAGIIWFVASILLGGVTVSLLLHPESSYNTESFHWFNIIEWTFTIGLIVDACRRPIPFNGARGIGKFFGTLLVLIVAVVIPALMVKLFFVQNFKIPTGAMQPTIMGIIVDAEGNKKPGDQIIVNKTAYWNRTPQRGDIVVFKTAGIEHPYVNRSAYYVKRIVGLPGETVSINPPNLVINGTPVVEPEIFRTISCGTNEYHGYTLAHQDAGGSFLTSPEDSITLKDGEYLTLGDNSKNSLDGRYYGPIKKSSIIGKAVFIYAPADRKQWIK